MVPCPDGYTEEEWGANFRQRLTLLNPFDPTENVTFEVGLAARQIPHNGAPRQWTPVSIFETELLLFPELEMGDFGLVTHGSFQVKNSRKYITDMRCREVVSLLFNLTNQAQRNNRPDQEPVIDWENYDLLCSSIPQDTIVFYYDHIRQPDGWNPERHGLWCPRRFALVKIPSLHSGGDPQTGGTKHTVVVAYLTPELKEQTPEGFQNPFGFHIEGYQDLLGYACLSNKCKVGQRTAGCCSHVAAALVFMGMHAYDPEGFWTTYKPSHFIDVANASSLNTELFGVDPLDA